MKLLDMWRASNIVNYPIKLKKMEAINKRSTTRAITIGKLIEGELSCHVKTTFYNDDNDATKAWNLAPEIIKTCKTIWSAKKEIIFFVKTLPI